MNGRELIIGVTGGIAAYKTAALVSRLVQAGAGRERGDDRRGHAVRRADDVRGADRHGRWAPAYSSQPESPLGRAHRAGSKRPT